MNRTQNNYVYGHFNDRVNDPSRLTFVSPVPFCCINRNASASHFAISPLSGFSVFDGVSTGPGVRSVQVFRSHYLVFVSAKMFLQTSGFVRVSCFQWTVDCEAMSGLLLTTMKAVFFLQLALGGVHF